MSPTLPRDMAHERFARVRDMLADDKPAAFIAQAEGLNLPATYNLIARTRAHFDAPLGLRPEGSKLSPKQYRRSDEDGDDDGAAA